MKECQNCFFFLFQKFHSIVLMAISDADYRFIYIDAGAYGSEGDSGVFAGTSIGEKILRDTLTLPENATVFSRSLPYFFIADGAFPMCNRILKPYVAKRGASLTEEQLLFNYRLSRARRCVENSFGILSARWLCLSRTMFCQPDKAQKIVAACCILHNMLMKSCKETYCPPNFADYYDAKGKFVPGEWRNRVGNNILAAPLNVNGKFNKTVGTEASKMRDHLKGYFNSPQGTVPWQRQSVFLENKKKN